MCKQFCVNRWCACMMEASERAKYNQIFEGLKPVNGKLSGDVVRPVLMNSKISVQVLSKIWILSDIDGDGFLDENEFAIAMHLVYRSLEGDALPTKLPDHLNLKLNSSTSVLAAASVPAEGSWVISATDMVIYEDIFQKTDLDMDGYVNGSEIKGIFLQSGLNQQTLAQIWRLSDTDQQGKLNLNQFALAMYLIKQKLEGAQLPATLSANMRPPSTTSLNPPAGLTASVDTPGMKELEAIVGEVEELKDEHKKLELVKAELNSDMSNSSQEIATLQRELDAIHSTVKQLTNQKSEAQKRLDELDDKKSKLIIHLEELKENCEKEEKAIESLKEQMKSSENTVKEQSDELKARQAELALLKATEDEFSSELSKDLAELHKLTEQANGKLSQKVIEEEKKTAMQDANIKLQNGVEQYKRILSGDATLDIPSANIDIHRIMQSGPESPVGAVDDDWTSKRFGDSNLFPSSGASSAFSSSGPSNDPFSGKKDESGAANYVPRITLIISDPFGGDPFTKNAHAPPKRPPPMRDQGFGAFPSQPAQSLADPFADAFGGVSAQNLHSPINLEDPFGTGSFSAQNLGNKSKGPPRPPAPKKSPSPVPNDSFAKFESDPWK